MLTCHRVDKIKKNRFVPEKVITCVETPPTPQKKIIIEQLDKNETNGIRIYLRLWLAILPSPPRHLESELDQRGTVYHWWAGLSWDWKLLPDTYKLPDILFWINNPELTMKYCCFHQTFGPLGCISQSQLFPSWPALQRIYLQHFRVKYVRSGKVQSFSSSESPVVFIDCRVGSISLLAFCCSISI